VKKGFECSYSLEGKLKKLFFISAKQGIAEALEKKGFAVEPGFVSWYAGHLWDSSRETMLRIDEALTKWKTIKAVRRR
jgi:hypothetical protein